jgi:hypothetical protein
MFLDPDDGAVDKHTDLERLADEMEALGTEVKAMENDVLAPLAESTDEREDTENVMGAAANEVGLPAALGREAKTNNGDLQFALEEAVEASPAKNPEEPQPSEPASKFTRTDSRIQQLKMTLPPLPPGIPEDVLGDIENLDLYMLAGHRQDAHDLLFDVTMSHPEWTAVIMERMALLERLSPSTAEL